MSSKYVTHQFAHIETLDRAERWLRQVGFQSSQIEVHREGVPWISVIASPERSAAVEAIFRAAELNDPDGWPSFWDLAQMPHPHVDATCAPEVTDSTVVSTHPNPIGWHPSDVADAVADPQGVAAVWDVNTRFGTGKPPKFRNR